MGDSTLADGAPTPEVGAVVPRVTPYGRQPLGPTPRWAWAALAGIVLAGLLVRLPGLGGPIVGYHSFNEAFYVDIARQYLHMGVLAPWLTSLELNNPPLYPSLLRLAMSVFGPSILVARALSTVAALGTAVAVFLLGKRLYGVVAGLGAAVVIALAPGSVLVGRNIQIEALLGLVVTLAALAWVIAADEDNVRWAVAAGALAGLAVLTKMQGFVIVPAFVLAEVIRARSLRRLVARIPVAAGLAVAAVGLPWHIWNLLQPVNASALGNKASELNLPSANFFDVYFAREWVGLLSPVVTLALLIGIGYFVWRRRSSDVLVLLGLLANVVFYLGYHHHSYYIYGALPFAALCAAALLEPRGRFDVRWSMVAVCLVAVLLVPFALTELAGKKLGYWSIDQVAAAVVAQGIDPNNTALAVYPAFRGSWEPALQLYSGGMDIVSNPLAAGDVLRPGERLVSFDPEPRPASADSTPLVRLGDEHVMPVLFGYGVDQNHEAVFYFAIDQPKFVRVGPWWRFGLARRTDPIDFWASLLSPSLTERIRVEASRESSAPAGP